VLATQQRRQDSSDPHATGPVSGLLVHRRPRARSTDHRRHDPESLQRAGKTTGQACRTKV
ncbi:FIG00954767: hypothetical protein, partial [Pseudomonas sp. FG-3G]